MDIDGDPFVFLYQLNAVFDMPQATLAQDVEFIKADIFCYMHIDLGSDETFGWQLQGGILVQWRFADEHPPACIER